MAIDGSSDPVNASNKSAPASTNHAHSYFAFHAL
jgi:hypothetical protein